MPRSNSSFGVAEGGSVVSAALAPGPRGGGGRRGRAGWYRRGRAARPGRVRRERRPAHRWRSAADRRQAHAARRARSDSGWGRRHRRGGGRGLRRRRLLNDRRRCRDLRLLVIAALRLAVTRLRLRVTGLGLRLPIGRIGLRHRRRRGHAGLGDGRLAAGCRRRAAELPQALFELAVAVLQFLVLAGQLPQLVFQPLDPHFRIGIVGLRESLGRQSQHRGNRRSAGRL